jgi:hypothetical protein
MAGAGRQDRYVAGTELDRAAVLSAKADLGGAARNAHHFVDSGMIMQVVINAVPPASAPAVAFEDILEDSGRIERTRQGIIREDRLREIPGAGDATAGIIARLHRTGTHPALEDMRKETATIRSSSVALMVQNRVPVEP